MIAYACNTPRANYQQIINNGLFQFGIESTEVHGPLAQFHGLSFSDQMIKVNVVKLPPPDLKYSKTLNPVYLSTGRWDLRQQNAAVLASAQSYTIIELVRSNGSSLGCLESFSTSFAGALRSFGLKITDPISKANDAGVLKLESEGHYPNSKIWEADYNIIGNHLASLKNTKHSIKLVVILLPDNDSTLYAMIKRVGDLRLGIHTVCHVQKPPPKVLKSAKTRDRSIKAPQYGPKSDLTTLANLHMKVNLKLGERSANQVLAKNSDKVLTPQTMLIGYDVTHPGTTSVVGAQSIAAVVGSVDENFAQYPASFRANPRPTADSGQSSERVLHLAEMIEERLQIFLERRRVLPDRLVVYRDGLSEAQFAMCQTLELPQIQQAISKVYNNKPHPPVILICAVKRHSARLFPELEGQNDTQVVDSKGNPVPGSTVFDGITYGKNNDFFLVSHQTLQGTARPCHYVVLHNEIPGLSISDVATTVSNFLSETNLIIY
jgi:eukaryotic translation initiation factor 2C